MRAIIAPLRMIYRVLFGLLDLFYITLDKRDVRRAKNILLIPRYARREGGRRSYMEWGHSVGIFETLFKQVVQEPAQAHLLDVGCGNGFLAIAAADLVQAGAKYTGIDVQADAIDFCRTHYQHPNYRFMHLKLHNAAYAQQQPDELVPWDIPTASVTLVTALSVWTHLREQHALFYFKEVDRVLAPGGHALITFFYLDERYDDIRDQQQGKSRYHNTKRAKWVFDQPLPETGEWFHPAWVKVPETAIGITPRGLEYLLDGTHLRVKTIYPGNWKERPGLYFQDIVLLENSRTLNHRHSTPPAVNAHRRLKAER